MQTLGKIKMNRMKNEFKNRLITFCRKIVFEYFPQEMIAFNLFAEDKMNDLIGGRNIVTI